MRPFIREPRGGMSVPDIKRQLGTKFYCCNSTSCGTRCCFPHFRSFHAPSPTHFSLQFRFVTLSTPPNTVVCVFSKKSLPSFQVHHTTPRYCSTACPSVKMGRARPATTIPAKPRGQRLRQVKQANRELRAHRPHGEFILSNELSCVTCLNTAAINYVPGDATMFVSHCGFLKKTSKVCDQCTSRRQTCLVVGSKWVS